MVNGFLGMGERGNTGLWLCCLLSLGKRALEFIAAPAFPEKTTSERAEGAAPLRGVAWGPMIAIAK